MVAGMRHDLIPSEDRIFAWISEVFARGVRRPGYPADRWAEDWCEQQFATLGLENVHREPVELAYWEPGDTALVITFGGGTAEIPCFALPHSCSADGLEARVALFDGTTTRGVEGAISLYDVPLTCMPQSVMTSLATGVYDPHSSFPSATQVLPFGREIMNVMEASIGAGAAGFIGVLAGYPGDSFEYYVPYDAVERPIPGVWVRGSDGRKLKDLLANGPVRATITVRAERKRITCYNIVGELPGSDDETVIIGSHHDGPWASAVEDGSGISLVLAQASYWSKTHIHERPHRLKFLLNAGHMAGGAGQRIFVETHRNELERVVLELHLEHAASEFAEYDGELRPTGDPEPRWWFTSRNPHLEAAVMNAIEAEDLRRSLILPPTVFGPRPTTDAGEFHLAGVPIVNYLTAPFYLFDAMDTLDKVHRPSLVPVTRAAIRIVESTRDVSAATMRAGVVT